MSYKVTRVHTRGRARYTKDVLTNLISFRFESRFPANLEEGRTRIEAKNISIAAINAQHFEDFFSNVVPVALQGFKRFKRVSGANRSLPGSGNAMVFHGTVQPLRIIFPGVGWAMAI